ncbi:hypothetical protein IFM89_016039 [Coptis chinensis]|uniref:Uncharacterized protein n=1 Tax=Coptis chinensis TaxID=261450 RepID=A0A835H8T5_9MAGN|nr:hypothetical protein IFM89_016039 [Coptis chinensis]
MGKKKICSKLMRTQSDGESKLGIYSEGPIDNQVLVDYEDHIARKIWTGKELIVTEATRLLKESLDIGGTQDVHGMLARGKMIYNILQFKQIIQESSQSGGGGENSGDVGENSGGGQDNGGDGGENSGDNMDIDTTKLTKRQLTMRQKRKK